MPRTTTSSTSTRWSSPRRYVGQGDGDEALDAARPRPRRPDPEALLAISPSSSAKSRRPPDGSEGQSDRAAARHQPHLGFALVRQQGRIRPAAARGHGDPQGADEGPQAGGGVEDRHRAAAQEVPRDDPFRPAGHRHRQEGRRHREAAPQGRGDDRLARSTSTSSRSASPRSTPPSSPSRSPSSSSAASPSGGR